MQQCTEEPDKRRHLVKALRMKEEEEEVGHMWPGADRRRPSRSQEATSTRPTKQETRVTVHMTHICSCTGREFVLGWLVVRQQQTSTDQKKQQETDFKMNKTTWKKCSWFLVFQIRNQSISVKCILSQWSATHTLPPSCAAHRCGSELDVSIIPQTCHRTRTGTRIQLNII